MSLGFGQAITMSNAVHRTKTKSGKHLTLQFCRFCEWCANQFADLFYHLLQFMGCCAQNNIILIILVHKIIHIHILRSIL
ncbi:hypothetical protein D3C79_1057110 [compost metagenome]